MNNKTIKITLLGKSSSGKISLMKTYNSNYNGKHLKTIGFGFVSYWFDFLGEKIKIRICDTEEQERFRNLTIQYTNGNDIIILVYSVDDKYSFEIIQNWLPQVKINCGEDGK